MIQPSLPLEVSCEEVKLLLDVGDEMLLLDCRETEEHEIVKLKGATLLPMSELMDRVGEIADFQTQQVAVYCHHGGRSLQVVQWLRENGFVHATSMAGGIDRWAIVIEPSMTRY